MARLPARRLPAVCIPPLLEEMVADVEKAIQFYRDNLGFTVIITVPESEAKVFAMLQRDQVELMLQSKASLMTDIPAVGSRAINPSIVLYIEVDDIHEFHDKVKASVEIVKPLGSTFYGMTEFYVKDLD